MKDVIYIFGHKNPDADAICAPIAYAYLKNKLGDHRYVAARCGNSNPRIDAILQRFRTPLPVFISDIYPRIVDTMVKNVHSVLQDDTCYKALKIIDQHDVRSVPVINQKKEINGLLSIFQLGEFFMPKLSEERRMRLVRSSLSSIAESLEGEIHYINNPDKMYRIEELYVRICAMSTDSFGENSHNTIPAKQSIIVVGNREDIQEKAIRMGVRLLVITGGFTIKSNIIDMAKENEVSIISSPHDTATTSWVIRTATVVNTISSKEVTCFSPLERLDQVRKKVTTIDSISYPVIDSKGTLVGMFSKSDLLKPVSKKIVMIDHNELGQAVDGAETAEIIEVIDHHRLGNPPSEYPIYFKNLPWGSSCSIVADMYQKQNVRPSESVAGLMMSGIISDTLFLQSPTTTEKDCELLLWLEDYAKISSKDLAELIFSSGSIILSASPEKVIESDCKQYQEGDLKYSAAQIEEIGFDNFNKNRTLLVDALEKYRTHHQLYFSALLVTDINRQDSLLVICGDPSVSQNIKYPSTDADHIFYLKNIVSRKKQLIPYLTSLIKSIDA